MRPSHVSLLSLIIGGFTLFSLGVGWAVMRRAYADWQDTKAKVKPLRKGFFSVLWTLIKVGTLVLAGLIALVWWNVHDFKQGPAPVDAGVSSPAPTRRAG